MKLKLAKEMLYTPYVWWAWYPVYCTDIRSIVWLETVIKEHTGYGRTDYFFEVEGVVK